MATPVGHTLAVGIIILASNREAAPRLTWQLVAFGIFLALAPDLDVIPDVLFSTDLHHGPTHSLLVGTAVAILTVVFLKGVLGWFREKGYLSLAAMGFLFYASHLAVDFVTLDNGSPFGMPLLWPITDVHIDSPVYVIPNVVRFSNPFGIHNLRVLWREVLVFGPPFLFLLLAERRHLKFRSGVVPLILAGLLVSAFVLFNTANPYY